jgi:hypothetical protein
MVPSKWGLRVWIEGEEYFAAWGMSCAVVTKNICAHFVIRQMGIKWIIATLYWVSFCVDFSMFFVRILYVWTMYTSNASII